MKELDYLKDLYIDEIKKINKKGELSAADAEGAKKALEAIHLIDQICRNEIDEYMGLGYSRSMMPEMAKYQDKHYSRNDATHHMIQQLETMLGEAPDEHKRRVIENAIADLQRY